MKRKSTFRAKTPFNVDVFVQGIPAQARVMTCYRKPPDPTTWASDLDYWGYTEIEFELLDRKGYPAEWLERKLDDETREEIENQISEYVEGYD